MDQVPACRAPRTPRRLLGPFLRKHGHCSRAPDRRRTWVAGSVWLLACVVQLLNPVAVPARQATAATPAAETSVSEPGTVDPVECRDEPRPLADFFALADITPTSATPAPRGSGPPPEGGIPAAPVVVAESYEAVRHLTACGTTRDTRFVTALWTDDFFRRSLSGVDLDDVLTPAAPVTARLPGMVSVRVLPDRRVLVETRTGAGTEFLAFVEQDGRYLLDDLFERTDTAFPIA